MEKLVDMINGENGLQGPKGECEICQKVENLSCLNCEDGETCKPNELSSFGVIHHMVCSKHKSEIESMFSIGQQFLEAGRLDEAICVFETITKMDNCNHYLTWMCCAGAYSNKGDYRKAITCADKLIEIGPENPSGYYSRGMTHFSLRNFEMALNDILFLIKNQQRFKFDPATIKNHILCVYILGTCYYEVGEMEKSFDIFDNGIKNFDYSKTQLMYYLDSYYLKRGNIHFQHFNKPELALKDYDMVVLLNPKEIDGFMNRGNVNKVIGNFQRAVEDFSKVIEMDPQRNNMFAQRSVCYEKLGKLEMALEDASKIIDNLVRYGRLGWMYYQMERFEDAAANLTHATNLYERMSETSSSSLTKKQFENYFISMKCLGSSLIQVEQYEKAMDCITRAIGLKKETDFDLLKIRAFASEYLDSMEIRTSVEYFTQALEVKNDDYECLQRRSICYLNLHEYDESLKDVEMCMRLRPKDEVSYIIRSIIYKKRFMEHKALEELNHALSINPASLDALYQRSDLLSSHKFEKYEDALNDIERAIDIDSSNTEYIVKKGSILESMTYATGKRPLEDRDFEGAMNCYEIAIALDPNCKEAFNKRGWLLCKRRHFEEGKKDLLKEFDSDGSKGSDSFLHLMKLFHLMEGIENMERGREIYNCNPISSTGLHTEDSEAIVDIVGGSDDKDYARTEPQTILDLYSRYSTKVKEKRKLDWNSKRITKMWNRVKTFESKSFYRFLRDGDVQGVEEEKEFIKLKEIIATKDVNEDISIFRYLGRGCFGRAYICRIKDVHGVFVIKLLTMIDDPEKSEKMMDRDCIDIGYHRNVVPILGKRKNEPIVVKNLPDRQIWEQNFGAHIDNEGFISTEMILMKYYFKTLDSYLNERLNSNTPFHDLEICYILQGIIRGAEYLHANRIVHRDLHIGNIFLYPGFGRAWIADFGCCLDLRNRKKEVEDFLVEKDDEIMFSSTNENSVNLNIGGSVVLAPELRYFDFKNESHFNYTKSDLYSIGLLGYSLVRSFSRMKKGEMISLLPYPSEEKHEDRKPLKREYVGLELCDPKLAEFMEGLLCIDVGERTGYKDALSILEGLIEEYESKERGKIEKRRKETVLSDHKE